MVIGGPVAERLRRWSISALVRRSPDQRLPRQRVRETRSLRDGRATRLKQTSSCDRHPARCHLQRLLTSRESPPILAQYSPTGHAPWAPRGCDPGGFFVSGAFVNRVVYLVDGFNLYHSLLDAERRVGRDLRWLDVAKLCASYLHALPGRCVVASVVFFFALPHHLELRHPGLVAQELRYLDAPAATGVELRLGQFKRRTRTCPSCGQPIVAFEEKETDVAIGTTMAAMVCDNECDTVVLVTGDTDLLPAIRVARERRGEKCLAALFPLGRFNAQLQAAVDFSWTLKAATYIAHQLPDPVLTPDGRAITRHRGVAGD